MYYVYTRSGQAVKRKKGPGQTVKSGFRAESSGQDRFQAVKNFDPGRERSYGKYWSDRPLGASTALTRGAALWQSQVVKIDFRRSRILGYARARSRKPAAF